MRTTLALTLSSFIIFSGCGIFDSGSSSKNKYTSQNSSIDENTEETEEETVLTPSFLPVAGTYTSTQSVSISTGTDEAEIYYTLDGSNPSCSGTKYSTSISVSSSKTIRAIACKDGMLDSEIAFAMYTISGGITPKAATPTFSPGTGTYTSPQTVTITESTPNTVVRYSTITTPTCSNGTVYTSPVAINVTSTLKAIACYTSGTGTSSDIASAVYTINNPICGGRGQSCCYASSSSPGTCDSTSDVCSSGICVECGKVGKPCCGIQAGPREDGCYGNSSGNCGSTNGCFCGSSKICTSKYNDGHVCTEDYQCKSESCVPHQGHNDYICSNLVLQ